MKRAIVILLICLFLLALWLYLSTGIAANGLGGDLSIIPTYTPTPILTYFPYTQFIRRNQ